MTMKRPLAESMGWCPVEERSMMERRRNPRAIPHAGSAHRPSSSGPRWVRADDILPTISNILDSELAAEVSRNPVIPHIRELPRLLPWPALHEREPYDRKPPSQR